MNGKNLLVAFSVVLIIPVVIVVMVITTLFLLAVVNPPAETAARPLRIRTLAPLPEQPVAVVEVVDQAGPVAVTVPRPAAPAIEEAVEAEPATEIVAAVIVPEAEAPPPATDIETGLEETAAEEAIAGNTDAIAEPETPPAEEPVVAAAVNPEPVESLPEAQSPVIEESNNEVTTPSEPVEPEEPVPTPTPPPPPPPPPPADSGSDFVPDSSFFDQLLEQVKE
jgi:hypothetical protein